MILTNQDLDAIEQYADKKKKADILLMIQTLKEVRQLKILLEKHHNTSNCCNDGPYSTDNSKDKHD